MNNNIQQNSDFRRHPRLIEADPNTSRKFFAILFVMVAFLFPVNEARAVITVAQTTQAVTTTASATQTTATFTPVADTLYLMWTIQTIGTSPPTVPTSVVCANGLTMVQVNTVVFATTGTPLKRLTLFRAMKPSGLLNGSCVISWGQTTTGHGHVIVAFTGADTSGTDGSGAVVQSVTGATNGATAAAGLSIALAALQTGSTTAGGFSNSVNNATSLAAGTGYTAGTGGAFGTPSTSLRAEWNTTGSTTVNMTQSAVSDIGGIAVEVKARRTTTLATGTDPAAVTIAPGVAATDVDLFTLQTDSGTEAITSVTVNLSTNNGVGRLAITDNAGTELGFTTSPVTGSNTITVAGMSATTTLTTFKVRVTPLSHAAMPVPPGAAYDITAPVTAWAGPNAHTGSDTNPNALTIDNLSPSGATAVSGTAGAAQVTLNWTTSVSVDFSRSVVLRWTGGTAGAEVPAEGTDYINGDTITTATVVCVRTADAASTAVSGVDGAGTGGCSATALTIGQAYTYKVFQKDSNGNYDVGVALGTFAPPPTVVSINRADTNPTSASSVSWSVTFSASVTGVNTADFTLVQAGGVSGASITSVTGSGTSWTVTANTGSGDGTLGLNLVDDDSIVAGSIPLGGTGAGNGNFTGQVYTVDKTAAVINTYYPGTADVAVGATTITLGASTGAATPIAAGDLVLIMQMQDASIVSTNDSYYGDNVFGDPGSGATDVRKSGQYEYAVAAGFSSPTLTLTCGTKNAYTNAAAGTDGQRKFQVIRVPVYASYTLGAITARAWDGSTGGVLAFDVTGALTLNSATVNVNGLGFRGGAARGLTGPGAGAVTDYRTLATVAVNGSKGEGIAGTPRYVFTAPSTLTNTGVEGYPNGSHARGAPGNAGGGGTDGSPTDNQENTGGGGGANAGTGGIGGIGWCGTFNAGSPPNYGCDNTGGFGGKAVSGLGATRLILGGGGGSGTTNNSTGTLGALSTSGTAGGGIVMIRAGSMTGSATFNANGSNGDTSVRNDGNGGGGAGGTVMINAGSGMGGVTINVNGGSGGSNLVPPGSTATPHGPGGGGGGGFAITSAATAGCTASGGANGVSYNNGVLFGAYGSTSGTGGSCVTGLTSAQIPGATIGPVSACSAINHYKISYPNGSPGVTCEALAVRITGHDASHAEVAPSNTTQITLSTSPATGGWALKSGGGTFTAPDKYTFNGSETYAEFWLTQTTPLANIDIDVVDNNGKTDLEGDVGEDARAEFKDTAFKYYSCPGAVPGSCAETSINPQIAGKSSNIAPNALSLYLRAVVKNTTTGACVGGLTGAQAVEFAYECDNPAVCSASNLMSINGGSATTIARNNDGTVSAIAGSYSAVNMTFDASGYAPFNLNYSDAGQVTLHARKTVTAGVGTPPSAAATIYGASNSFVVRPFAFSITGAGIPAATGLPTDTVFKIAGEDFPATITAVVWQAGDDTDNDGAPDPSAVLSDNAATPNFGQESTPEGATLTNEMVRPAGAPLVLIGGNTVYTGFMTGAKQQDINWPEVGSIKLVATLTSGNYLASLQTVTGFVSPVGRFRPHHFIVTPVALTNRWQSDCATAPKTASTFTYIGEQMEVTDFKVTARNALATPGQTSYYASTFPDPNDNFAKLDGAVFANFGFGAVDLADAIPPLAATALTLDAALSSSSGSWTNGEGKFTAKTAVMRAAPEGPYETFWLGIVPADTDGVTLRAADLNLDTTVPINGDDRAKVISAFGSVRFGRLRLQNAYGSELLPLPIPMTVQYWNGTAFVTNALDRCTQLTAANIGFANYTQGLAAGETTPTVGTVFSAGVGSLTLSAPGTGNNGSVDLAINLGAAAADEVTCPTLTPNPATTGSDRDYLRGRWCGAAYDKDPTARATFGVYANPSQFIYLREMY
jgi:hypothetical protein